MTARVLHVVNGLGLGGTERLCLGTVRASPRDCSPFILNFTPTRQNLRQEFAAAGTLLPDSATPIARRSAFIREFASTVSKYRFDGIISYTFGMAHIAIAVGAALGGCRNVIASAGNTAPSASFKRARWASVLVASEFLGVPIASASTAIERSLLSLGVGLPKRSRVIPNGIELSEFGSFPRKSSNTGIQLGMVARLDSIKDHRTLLKAIAIVAENEPQLHLNLVGDGPLRESLESLTDELQIRNRVTFFGNRSDVADLLKRWDVFVLSTTEAEGFGIAVAEAMAAGVPVVASDVSACREVLAGGALGLLVPPANPHALAATLRDALAHPDRRRRRALRAQEHARDRFSATQCSRDLHALVLNRSPLDQSLAQ